MMQIEDTALTEEVVRLKLPDSSKASQCPSEDKLEGLA